MRGVGIRRLVMIGRREFASAGIAAGAMAAMGATAHAATGDGHGEHDVAEQCAKACSDCQRACDMCSTHCANQVKEGKTEHMTTLATCQDCADFCVAAAQIVARGGPFTKEICRSCAEACNQCAAACEKFPDDKHMKMCAEECRKCEKACKAMAA